MGAVLRRVVAGAGHMPRPHGARRAGGDRAVAARPFPRRHRLAQRPGVGADQRAVLRVLVARSGLGVGCDGPGAGIAAKRQSTCATCRSCGWSRRRWPMRAAGGSPSVGWRSSSAVWTLDALLQALSGGTSPLFSGIDPIKQLISGHAMCSGRGHRRARPPQRRARPVQPQARTGAGQPVAVRAVSPRASASAGSAGAWPRPRSAW